MAQIRSPELGDLMIFCRGFAEIPRFPVVFALRFYFFFALPKGLLDFFLGFLSANPSEPNIEP